MVKCVVMWLMLAGCSVTCDAQDANVLRRVADAQQQMSSEQAPRAANFFTMKDASELRLVLSDIVRLYQLLISSQDTDVCAYEPSCSRFGMLSMKRFGVLRGFLLTSDRLTRCNTLTDSQHERNSITGKYRDPVESYDTYLHDHP